MRKNHLRHGGVTMRHILFGSDVNDIKIAVLLKETALNKAKIERFYLTPQPNLKPSDFIAFDLKYDTAKKCSVKTARLHLDELMPEIEQMGIDTLMVTDGVYFKALTKSKTVESSYGYVKPCTYPGYEHMNVIVCPNYQVITFNPDAQEKIDRCLECLDTYMMGKYEEPGKDVIHSEYYPHTVEDIQKTLDALHRFPELVCDIETKSLEFWNCGISTIAFAWDKHNGVAFGVERIRDLVTTVSSGLDWVVDWTPKAGVDQIKRMLLHFFLNFEGKVIYHNIAYDAKVLVYELFMQGLDDYRGMIDGIQVMTKDFDDTMLIAYFATNNAVQNVLDLKTLSAPYMGDYAEDVKDTTKVPLQTLLSYNLKDCLATWYVKETYEPVMIADQQQAYYEEHAKEHIPTLMQTELNGMPISPPKVKEAKDHLTAIQLECYEFFDKSDLIKTFHMGELIRYAGEKTQKAAAASKTSRATKIYKVTDSVIESFVFNPGSDTQLRRLLFDYLGYPILDLTDTKLASCAGKTIKKLLAQAKNEEHKKMFECLLQLADVNIILSTFIPAFENAQQLPDGSYRLYGNYKLTGTQSLRPSSQKPGL